MGDRAVRHLVRDRQEAAIRHQQYSRVQDITEQEEDHTTMEEVVVDMGMTGVDIASRDLHNHHSLHGEAIHRIQWVEEDMERTIRMDSLNRGLHLDSNLRAYLQAPGREGSENEKIACLAFKGGRLEIG